MGFRVIFHYFSFFPLVQDIEINAEDLGRRKSKAINREFISTINHPFNKARGYKYLKHE